MRVKWPAAGRRNELYPPFQGPRFKDRYAFYALCSANLPFFLHPLGLRPHAGRRPGSASVLRTTGKVQTPVLRALQ